MESWERKRGEGQRGARAGQRGRHPLVSSFLIKSVLWLQSSEVNERRGKERREKGRPSTFSSRLAAESGHQEHQVGREARKRGNCDSFTLANCPSMIKEKFHLTFAKVLQFLWIVWFGTRLENKRIELVIQDGVDTKYPLNKFVQVKCLFKSVIFVQINHIIRWMICCKIYN